LIEFNTNTGLVKALELNKTILKGREVKVTEKTIKIPNYLSSKSNFLIFLIFLIFLNNLINNIKFNFIGMLLLVYKIFI
jgi:hypothetical protein